MDKRGDALDRGIGALSDVRGARRSRPSIEGSNRRSSHRSSGRRCKKCGTCFGVCPVSPEAVRFEDGDRSRPPAHHDDRCIRCY